MWVKWVMMGIVRDKHECLSSSRLVGEEAALRSQGGWFHCDWAHDIQIFRLSKPKPTSVRRAAVAAAVVGNESSIHRHPGRRAMTESGRAGDKETTSNQTVEPVK